MEAPGRPDPRLEALREQLDRLDGELLQLMARRQHTIAEIGRLKAQDGRPVRDFAREKQVLDRATAQARELGLAPELARDVLRRLIQASLTRQEQDRVAQTARGVGERALIIGGAGKMGAWFARFLDAQGYTVTVADPAGGGGFPARPDWRAGPVDQDLIVVATPIATTNELLLELARAAPPGLVFDLASLKTPLRDGLRALGKAGAQVASLHPMFGPDTELLSGRHVILVDVGDAAAVDRLGALFADTMAVPVRMSLDTHDRTIAFVLGLSHALNLVFCSALSASGRHIPELQRISSTTFSSQLEVATRVSSENPHLYYEIQALNRYGLESLDALCEAANALRHVVRKRDREQFVAIMEAGRRYVETTGSGPPR